MKYLKLFEEYIYETSIRDEYTKKVGWILQEDNADDLKSPLNVKAREALYDTYYIKEEHDDSQVKVNHSIPILFYGTSNGEKTDVFLKDKAVREENLYNSRQSLGKSGDKVVFAQMFAGKPWLPQTTTDKLDVLNGLLDFPLVAKIRNGHSGVGIEKFNSKEEFASCERDYDLYTKCIDFVKEYRVVFCKNNIVCVNERVTVNGSGLDKKKSNESIDFIYVYQDMSKLPEKLFTDIEKIRRDIQEANPLDLWSLDIVIDQNDKVWVLETSANTGLGATKMCEVYNAIYEDFYKKPLPANFLEGLHTNYVIPEQSEVWKSYKKEVMSSECGMDYNKVTGNGGADYFFNKINKL